MAEFVSFHPDNETLGINILTTIAALDAVESLTDLLEKHGLIFVDPDEWYPLQAELDLLQDLDQVGYYNMVTVGMTIPEVMGLPREPRSVTEALLQVPELYKMQHRGPLTGWIRYEHIDDTCGTMTCHTPYPSDRDYGLIYRLVQKYRTGDYFLIKRDDSVPNRKSGGDTCVYHIEWS